MSKYTPGPWLFKQQASGALDFFGEGGKYIVLSNARLINQEANAKLIAAAPELLQALEMVMAKYSKHLDNFAFEQCYSAIAKAAGRVHNE